ncbi:9967_t:CDS:2 [Funneliformis geosporum]|nr:9967_t:CDS:2 [Funneliformis geosporum]
MSTLGKRPDFGFILNHVCSFRKEKKSLINNDDPNAELRDKLDWIYDSAPYVLGYYANGPEVIFVAICKPSFGNNPKVINIVKSNLNLRKDCILNLRRIINLSILIKSLQDVIGWHETPEFCPIERSKGMSVKPKNQKELLEAIFCVFETLVWPNIIKLPGEQSKWILIDWDDADGPPTRPAKHLGKENHAPEAFEENHGGEVDIWVQMQSINRPSAHDALEFFRSLTK